MILGRKAREVTKSINLNWKQKNGSNHIPLQCNRTMLKEERNVSFKTQVNIILMKIVHSRAVQFELNRLGIFLL